MSLKIIHFDLGANMAYAHNCCDGVVIADHFVAQGDRRQRALQTMRWLENRFTIMNVEHCLPHAVHFERPFARGQAATRSLWGVAGILEAIAQGFKLDTFDSTPAEIKKFAAQFGGATKGDMIAAARQMGYMGHNEHEADAWCGLKYAETVIV